MIWTAVFFWQQESHTKFYKFRTLALKRKALTSVNLSSFSKISMNQTGRIRRIETFAIWTCRMNRYGLWISTIISGDISTPNVSIGIMYSIRCFQVVITRSSLHFRMLNVPSITFVFQIIGKWYSLFTIPSLAFFSYSINKVLRDNQQKAVPIWLIAIC